VFVFIDVYDFSKNLYASESLYLLVTLSFQDP